MNALKNLLIVNTVVVISLMILWQSSTLGTLYPIEYVILIGVNINVSMYSMLYYTIFNESTTVGVSGIQNFDIKNAILFLYTLLIPVLSIIIINTPGINTEPMSLIMSSSIILYMISNMIGQFILYKSLKVFHVG